MPWKLTESGQDLWRRSQTPGEPANNGLEPVWKGDENRDLYDLDPEWKANYQTAELGPNGEELPNGALGWRPNGDPYWGEGFSGLANELRYAWNKPREEPLGKDHIQFSDLGTPNLATLTTGAEYISSNISNLPGRFMSAGRVVSNTVKATFGFFDEVSKYTERGLGTGTETLNDIGEGSVLPEYLSPWEVKPYKWNENFGLWALQKMPRLLSGFLEQPGVITYNTARAVTAPMKDWDFISKSAGQNWEASRLLYSTWLDSSIKDEYIRRFNSGEYQFAETLAEELEIPSAELVGRMVIDPTNLVGGFINKVKPLFKLGLVDVGRFGSKADEFIKVPKFIDDAFQALAHADELEAEAKIIDLARVQVKYADEVAKGLDEFSKSNHLFQLTQSGKKFHVSRRATTMSHWIARMSDNPDDAFEIFEALADIASADELRTAAGIARLQKFKAPTSLYSRAGQELGQLIHNVTKSDKWDDILKQVDEIKKGDNAIEELIKLSDGWIDEATNQMFPTIAERLARGDDVPSWKKALATFHDRAQKGYGIIPGYEKINTFFSGIYMGMSPGYAFRNSFTNNFQMLVDYGPSAFGKGTFFNPGKWTDKIMFWLDEMPQSVFQGMGLHTAEIGALTKNPISKKALDVLKGEKGAKKWQAFSRLSEYFEQRSSVRIVGHAVDEAMNAMLKPGKALPDLNVLGDAGFSRRSIDALNNLVIREGGNVRRAKAKYLEMIKDGYVDNYGLLTWLDEADKSRLIENGIFEDFQDIFTNKNLNKSLDTQLNAVDDLWSRMRQAAREAADEHAGINVDDLPESYEGAVAMMEAQNAGDIAEDMITLSNNQAVANSNALGKFDESLMNMRAEVANRLDRMVQQGVEGAAGIRDEFYNLWTEPAIDAIVKNTERAKASTKDKEWLAQVWEWTREIKGDNPFAKEGINSYSDWWDYIGIPLEKPGQVTRSDLTNALWEGYFRPLRRENWSGIRDVHTEAVNGLAGRIQMITGIDTRSYFEEANKLLEHARTLDTVAINPSDNRMYTLAKTLRDNLELNRNENAIRVLANQYGIYSASKGGTGFNTYAVRVINKYGNKNYTLLSQASIDEAWEAFEAMRVAKRADAPPLIENLDLLLGRIRRPAEAADDILPAWQSLDEVPEVILDEARRTNFTLNDDELLQQINEIHRPQEVMDWVGTPNQEPIMPPYDGRNPSGWRVFQESQDPISDLLTKLKGDMRTNYATAEEVILGDTKLAAIEKYFNVADERISQAKLVAAQYANEARAFTLHDYPAKRNLDLVASYIMPYNFWYTRTYAKWLTNRIWQNPGWVAAYAKYKDAMAKIHAGAPDWWKYNINSNEILGLNKDNPLFFNLEATLNPLNGITGIDFDDPYKRVDFWTSTMDAVGRFGPSTHTMFSMMLAYSLYKKGQQGAVGEWDGQVINPEDYSEASGRWASRLIPQTAVIKAGSEKIRQWTGTALIPSGGLELDPATWFFSGGVDPYERRRVGRSLATLVDDGKITQEQAIDAAWRQQGDAWDMARERATQMRGWGQLASFFMGVGFKSRTPQDMEVDRFYQDYSKLWQQEALLSPEEFRTGMSDLRNKYPFMDAVLISKKGGTARDRAYAYNVMSRISPGKSDDFAEAVGISGDLLGKFYDDKGHIELWSESERTRFIAGMIDLGAVLSLPDNATQARWNMARNSYSEMKRIGEQQWGEDIWDMVDVFYQFDTSTQAGRDARKAYTAQFPQVQQALDWQTQNTLSDETMIPYYASVDKLEGYMKGQMYDQIDAELGDMQEFWNTYYFLKDTGDNSYKKLYRENKDRVDRYFEIKDEWEEKITERLIDFNRLLGEGDLPSMRQDADIGTVGGLAIQEQLQPQNPYSALTKSQWQITLGKSAVAVISRGDIPDEVEDYLFDIAQSMGMSYDEFIDTVANSR